VLTPRLSCFTRDDGSIDFERTNDETVERLAKALEQPEAKQKLRLVVGNNPEPERSWSGMVPTFVDAVNAIAVQFAVNRWTLADSEARYFLLRRKPETFAQLAACFTRILDKRLPGGFGEYDDEITALILVVGFVTEGVQAVSAGRAPATVASFPPMTAAAAH